LDHWWLAVFRGLVGKVEHIKLSIDVMVTQVIGTFTHLGRDKEGFIRYVYPSG
jgi:hypothetical protein